MKQHSDCIAISLYEVQMFVFVVTGMNNISKNVNLKICLHFLNKKI